MLKTLLTEEIEELVEDPYFIYERRKGKIDEGRMEKEHPEQTLQQDIKETSNQDPKYVSKKRKRWEATTDQHTMLNNQPSNTQEEEISYMEANKNIIKKSCQDQTLNMQAQVINEDNDKFLQRFKQFIQVGDNYELSLDDGVESPVRLCDFLNKTGRRKYNCSITFIKPYMENIIRISVLDYLVLEAGIKNYKGPKKISFAQRLEEFKKITMGSFYEYICEKGKASHLCSDLNKAAYKYQCNDKFFIVNKDRIRISIMNFDTIYNKAKNLPTENKRISHGDRKYVEENDGNFYHYYNETENRGAKR